MSKTHKLIAKHREVYKLSTACTKLAKLATRERAWIEASPDTSSRHIEMQQLKYQLRDDMARLSKIAWSRCLLIDGR